MSGTAANPFRQPRAVYAVAFACVVSFMGIGLVDPILPAISHQLNASPSEVTLLFTSYLVVTALAMLITNWVSSRIGAKKTLIAGAPRHGGLATLMDASISQALLRQAHAHVLIINPESPVSAERLPKPSELAVRGQG
jgi:MFS transporter, ACDE family, multidrug resistance protein